MLCLEILLEFLFEIIVEGIIELGTKKKVPMPVRILAAGNLLAIFVGIGGMFMYMVYVSGLAGNAMAAIAFGGVGVFLMFGGIFIILKMFRKKKEC